MNEINIGPYEKLEANDGSLLLAISSSAAQCVKQPNLQNVIKETTMQLALLVILLCI